MNPAPAGCAELSVAAAPPPPAMHQPFTFSTAASHASLFPEECSTGHSAITHTSELMSCHVLASTD